MSAGGSGDAVRKARILCLHGYMQTGEMFRAKSGAFRKKLRAVADFTYVDAPHAAERGYMWSESVGEGAERTYRGLSESLAYVSDLGEFDGVLGFSQGAVFASILAAFNSNKYQFAVLVSGFPARNKADGNLWYGDADNSIDMPSLHIWGERDDLVPPEGSMKLRDLFVNPQFAAHDGGHVMPGKRVTLDVVKQFITERNIERAKKEGVLGSSVGNMGKL